MSDSLVLAILPRAIGGEQINAVDARELHRALDVGKVFAAWIRERIDQLGLSEGVDFEVFSEPGKNPLGGRPTIEYVVTLDAAKHLALAERNTKGREIRAYFIEAEKKLRDPVALLDNPDVLRKLLGNYAERQIALESENRVLAERLVEAAPKAAFADSVFDCGDTLGFRQACQQIKAATGANENEVRGLMRKRNWIQRLDGRLSPAAYGQDAGYVTTREREYTDDEGARRVRPELRVTQKGLARAIELLRSTEAA